MMKRNVLAPLSAAVVGLGALLMASAPANAILNVAYQFNGRGNWSLDAVGDNTSPVGGLSMVVPVGATIERAFLYSSTYSGGSSDLRLTSANTGTTYLGGAATALGLEAGFLQAFRHDVTAQIAAAHAAGDSAFTVDELTNNVGTDGEVLAVIYSDPAEMVRTIAFLDGHGAQDGDTTTFNLSDPLDTSIAGFEAQMSLGIGFSFQGTAQASDVDVDNDGVGPNLPRALTSSAGGEDDGAGPFNGALITVGGLGDSTGNPADPDSGPNGNPRQDDELYNLAAGNGVDASPFLVSGVTQFSFNTANTSHDDLIFFLGLNITAEGNVNNPTVPEPGTVALLSAGLLSLPLVLRRRRK